MTTKTIRNILVAVDLSSCSRAALEFACALAGRLDAQVEVLFVQQPDGSQGKQEVAAVQAELHRFIETVPAAQASGCRERIELGEAQQRIVAIGDHGFDAIVLGTHGRTGRPRSLAGSVAESVVRTASCPVITVREPR
jgi:universal stress protein A